MKARPYLSTTRAADIFEQAMSWRQTFCLCNDYNDNDFFKTPTFLSWLFGEDENWKIKKFRSKLGEDHVPKAAIVSFDGRVTLTVNQAIWDGAALGKWFENFMLAHEVAHLGLSHHTRSATTKNFQLSRVNNVNSNLPPTMQELEANYAGVFFQCGAALFDPNLSPVQLAKLAFSDVSYVEKAQKAVRLTVFKSELQRSKPSHPRVVL